MEAQRCTNLARLGSSRFVSLSRLLCKTGTHTHRHISIALSVSVDVSLSVCKQSNQETNWVIGSLYCRSQRHPLVNVNYTIVSNHFSLLLLLILSFFCCEFFVIFSIFILSLSVCVSCAPSCLQDSIKFFHRSEKCILSWYAYTERNWKEANKKWKNLWKYHSTYSIYVLTKKKFILSVNYIIIIILLSDS